ncbi:MAG: carbohydrate porin [Flavihumibacter sp.]
MNWSLMSNGAWDYPANTRGYTYSLMAELILPCWEFRAATSMVPTYANGPSIDLHYFKAHAETVEAARKFRLANRPGILRLLAFRNVTKAPAYQTATATDKDVIYGKRYGGVKYGFGMSAEQEIAKDLSLFARAGWNDGKTATWAFTEIDQTASAGLTAGGARWRRNDDKLGIAIVGNGISADHAAFLASGGYGFMVGDGKLNRRGTETIAEIFYSAALLPHCWLSVDYQFVSNPGYNKDRGPVHVFAARAHISF